MGPCVPTLLRHAQGSLMPVWVVSEDGRSSAHVVVEISRYPGWVSRGVRVGGREVLMS